MTIVVLLAAKSRISDDERLVMSTLWNPFADVRLSVFRNAGMPGLT
jgi:hypothetical protein